MGPDKKDRPAPLTARRLSRRPLPRIYISTGATLLRCQHLIVVEEVYTTKAQSIRPWSTQLEAIWQGSMSFFKATRR